VLVQIVIGAAMVLNRLEGSLRATHVALGVAVFVVLVRFAWLARYPEPAEREAAREGAAA